MPSDPSPAVPTAEVATVDVRDLSAADPLVRRGAVSAFGRSLVGTGFVRIGGDPVDPQVLDAAYAAAAQVFALPPEALARHVRPELHGARGLVPFGREKAKDAMVADLKEFWHVGPEGVGPANVWPDEVPAFRTAMMSPTATRPPLSSARQVAALSFSSLPSTRSTSGMAAKSCASVCAAQPVTMTRVPGRSRRSRRMV